MNGSHSEAGKIEVGKRDAARSIAVIARKARRGNKLPGVTWLGGYRSDMNGTKAQAIDAWCERMGVAFVRHDYSGHGASGGDFRDGTISRWVEESLAVFNKFAKGPQVLVGSSMGGWIALRMAQELEKRGKRLHAMLLIAPAPDFTERLMWPKLSEAQQAAILRDGVLEEPSQYSSAPDIYTRELFEDGRRNLVLTGEVATHCPVHILQGRLDPDVPWTHAMALANQLIHESVSMTLVPDGDHRLSRPQDIELILNALERLVEGS
jgi:pimeloyl-ACP methyl ester carboxylesterase